MTDVGVGCFYFERDYDSGQTSAITFRRIAGFAVAVRQLVAKIQIIKY